MIRCPFNSFGKCDGSCPFSTENFRSCGLERMLAELGGQARGIHAQMVTANAHLAEAKGQQADQPRKRIQQRAQVADSCYLYRNERDDGSADVKLALSSEVAAKVADEMGGKVDVLLIPGAKSFVVAGGTRATVSRTTAMAPRATISVGFAREAIEAAFGTHRYAYLAPSFGGGVLRLTATGEVED